MLHLEVVRPPDWDRACSVGARQSSVRRIMHTLYYRARSTSPGKTCRDTSSESDRCLGEGLNHSFRVDREGRVYVCMGIGCSSVLHHFHLLVSTSIIHYTMSTVARTLKYAVLGTGRMVSLLVPILPHPLTWSICLKDLQLMIREQDTLRM